MNIAVILKQTPDTEAKIVIDSGDSSRIVEDDIKMILNPYDEYAVEEALTIKSDVGGEVVGVCIGKEKAETAIRSALAMGVDRAILISDPDAVNADVITQSKILAAAIKTLDASLILCGKEWIDSQDDAVGAAVAQFLDAPHILEADKITVDGDSITVVREMDGGSLEIGSSLPAVVSCSKNLNEPRYPTLIAIKRSKKKEIKAMTLTDFGLELDGPKSKILQFQKPPARAAGKVVTGEPEDVASQAVAWLSDEAKVI